MSNLPVPVALLKTEISGQWNASNVAAPKFIEVNVSAQSVRYDLNATDALLFKAGSPTIAETPIGNWQYVDRVYNVELEINTQVSRQRLYNLVQEIRRICYARFNELTQNQANIWSGTVSIQLVNNAEQASTT